MYYLLKKLKSQKKEKIIILLILVIGTLVSVQISSSEYSGLLQNGGRFGLQFYYTVMSAGIVIWIFILFILIVPNLWAVDFLTDKNSKFSNILKTRFGTTKYIKKSFLTNYIISTLTILIVQLIILLYIHIFLAPIKFDINVTPDLTTDASTFVNSEFLNLLIFIIFNSIGYGVFSNFIFSLQLFVKNIYVFRVLGVAVGLILYTGPVLLAKTFSFIPILEKLISNFFIGYLINPGVITTTQIFQTNPFITYIVSIIIYSSICIVFMKIFIKREYMYD